MITRKMAWLLAAVLFTLVFSACSPASGTVKLGEIGYIANPEWNTSLPYSKKYTRILYVNDTWTSNDPVTVTKGLVVPDGYKGVLKDDPSQVYVPGNYPKVISTDVILYPTTDLLFRILPEDRKNDPAACQGIVCDGSITDMVLKGGNTLKSVEIDVHFQFSVSTETSENLIRYVGDPVNFIKTYISQTVRGARTMTRDMTVEEAIDPAGWDTIASGFKALLDKTMKPYPVVINSVSVRHVYPTDDYVKAQVDNKATMNAVNVQATVTAQAQTQAQNQLNYQATMAAIARDQQLQDAESCGKALGLVVKDIDPNHTDSYFYQKAMDKVCPTK